MQPDTLDDAKLSATDVIKSALKGVIQKTAGQLVSGWIGIKIANKSTIFAKNSPQNIWEAVESEI